MYVLFNWFFCSTFAFGNTDTIVLIEKPPARYASGSKLQGVIQPPRG